MMIFFLLILLLIIFSASTVEKKNTFHSDYISKDHTNNVKGIFVILILLSHGKQYLALGGPFDEPYIAFQNHLNQMVVAMFFFYSGYGIMEQIKKRGFDYIKSIPTKRFPNLLLNFDIAAVLYILLALALGKTVTVKNALLSLTAWVGIGNSSWYIFITFGLYIITFISFLLLKKADSKKMQFVYLTVQTVLSVVFIFIMMKTGKERFWYNTLILYALGFWYSYGKDAVEKLVMKSDLVYLSIMAVTVIAYIVTFRMRWQRLAFFTLWECCFVALCVLLTMKVSLKSNLLQWFGEHIFSIYILQRIPMIILQHMGVAKSNKYVFMILSIAVTLALAELFDVLTGRLAANIWKPNKAITKTERQ